MDEEFDCEPYQPKDERNRRFKNDNPKTRSNVMEAAKREEQKAKRIKQSQADSQLTQIEEEETEQETRRRSKRIIQKNMSKDEKKQLYEKDMEECAKALKGKHRIII